ncbi:MAG: formylglycine-generating enzyme family protein [Bacteroidales bacterium]|jgi:formylglycine-generating enzyme required for sulfatase activity|nr:formylglycine-generating enzyme family protein [Bacteroidales bacterium]
MKKTLLLSILFAAGTFGVKAQSSDEPVFQRTMHIYRGGNDVPQNIPVSDVDSITFSLDELISVVEVSDSTYSVGGVFFTMKGVTGGSFTMGCTAEQGDDSYSNESPAHNVNLSSYSIGETEVTQELWEAVMGKSLSEIISENGWDSSGIGDNYPMYFISWNDIVGTSSSTVAYTIKGVTYYQDGFCYKLSQLVGGGKQFRLPTEAEWEYAARGGSLAESQTKYSGSNAIGNVAWYSDNSSNKTNEVASKDSNALGLYDMSGNLWEWCSDFYGDYSSSSQTNPTGSVSGYTRVLRGGGWNGGARDCRVSRRINDAGPTPRFNKFGFRLAVSSN